VLSGLAVAIVATVIFVAALLVFVNWRMEPPPPGGVVAIFINPYQALLAAAIGFGIGFSWNVRRQRRKLRA
jgi:hypothetical protein